MIYLASKSPRRRQLLQQIGIEFDVLEVDIYEQWDGIETAQAYVKRLALNKARAGRDIAKETYPILAADTEVIIDDEILGKPEGKAGAMHMLQKLSGCTHQVLSAVALISDSEAVSLNINLVSFKPLTLHECNAYCETGEPYDKAGGYAIQGKAANFISRLEGSYSGVMGLPLFETTQLLNKL